MYRRIIDDLRPGMVVAQDVSDAAGHVLLGTGVALTSSYFEGLRHARSWGRPPRGLTRTVTMAVSVPPLPSETV